MRTNCSGHFSYTGAEQNQPITHRRPNMTIENSTQIDERQEMECGGAPFLYDADLVGQINNLADRVAEMRTIGKLSRDSLMSIQKYFRIKNIYHSNAIEGNKLNLGETRQVVESGLTIAGKTLKDQAEAKNLNHALDYLENLATMTSDPIMLIDIRQIHSLILKDIDDENAGQFRRTDVTISGSDFQTTPAVTVDAAMRDFIDWLGVVSLANSNDVIVTASACHAWFAQIHPFTDGNGRTARILMNLILMRSGYPIAIMTKEDRIRYYDALEESQGSDLTPFIELVIECVSETLDEYEAAVEEQREQMEWTLSIAKRITPPEMPKIRNEYELWRNAMELMFSQYRVIVGSVNEMVPGLQVRFRDYGMLEFEKYLSLRSRHSAKKTWFFGMEFNQLGAAPVRYLYWFGFSNRPMSDHALVSLHLSREESKYRYVKLDDITRPNVPNIREVAYSLANDEFVVRKHDLCLRQRIERISRDFFDEVISKHFKN